VVAVLESSRPGDLDPEAMSDAELADELVALRREIDRMEARFAQLAWAGHRRGLGAVDGSPSTQAWLRRRTGMREGDARAAIETGEVSELLPSIGAAWRHGAVTTGAVRTISGARVDGHDLKLVALEDLLLVLARADDQRELRRACTHFRNCARADGTEPREHDGLTLNTDYHGATHVHAQLSSAGAEIVATALHALTDPPSDGDTRSASRRRADALVRMGELALAHLAEADDDGPTRAIPSASVVIDWTTLTGEGWGRMDGDYTGTLHPDDIERLLCDCTLSRVVTGQDGLPLDVGRSRRTIPPQIRRALAVRDHGCRYPGCNRPHGWTRAHHVVHLPRWTASFDGHTFEVLTPDGTPVT
jgi:hypothetical protein